MIEKRAVNQSGRMWSGSPVRWFWIWKTKNSWTATNASVFSAIRRANKERVSPEYKAFLMMTELQVCPRRVKE
jgi:hypothetical protein